MCTLLTRSMSTALNQKREMGIQTKKAQKRQLKNQMLLNQQVAELGYDYGEKSAENAYKRQLELYEKQLADTREDTATQYQTQIADVKAAGLSPGLLYAGAGGGGGGGGATAASTAQGRAPSGLDPGSAAEAEMLSLQRKALYKEIAEAGSQAHLNYTEAQKLKAETQTENQLRNPLEEELRQRGYKQWIENAEKDYYHKGGQHGERAGADYENKEYGILSIGADSLITEGKAAELAEVWSKANANNAAAELDTEKKKQYWRELLVAEAKGEAEQAKAAAVKLAAEWQTGEYTNWKTWQSIGTDILGQLLKLAL